MDVLTINSYAGSLVLGAKAGGYSIRGSYEDAGFGIAAQKLNFPDLRYVDQLPWPEDDLSDTVVIAHPPCASFSNQNTGKQKGTDTAGFNCHRKVMSYSLGQSCAGLAIESVKGAYAGAAAEYAKFAERYDYNHYFLFLNSASFGVPQWRPRFWVLFTRKEQQLDQLRLTLRPRYRYVGDVLDPHGQPATGYYNSKQRYFAHRMAAASFDFEGWKKLEMVGDFTTTVSAFLGIEKDDAEVRRRTGVKGAFSVGLPRKLDLAGFTPVLLIDSYWFAHDRPLNRTELQRVMGFPDDWRWPSQMEPEFTKYLSKGVCPPVATWILEQLFANLTSPPRADFTHNIQAGSLVDLQPKKGDALHENSRDRHDQPDDRFAATEA